MSKVKEIKKEKGLLSQILRKFFRREGGSKNLAEVMADSGVDLREGKDSSAGIRISWKRGQDGKRFIRIDVKGRVFVGQKFSGETTWGLNFRQPKTNQYGERKWGIINKITTTPAVIQINVRAATGKRGGWFINVHEQVPFFKEDRFVFRCSWRNYWASDAMVVAGLASKFTNGKLGKAIYLNEVLGDSERVALVIEMVNECQEFSGKEPLPSHEARMNKKMWDKIEREEFLRQWKNDKLVTF